MKRYNVCWSGGLDSTFVVTQLSQFPVIIRPFYIKGQTYRLSEPQELETIATVREMLLADPRTKAEILVPEIVEKDDPRIEDREMVLAHRRIYMRLLKEYKDAHGGKLLPAGSQQIYADGAFISPQYIACASLAKYLGEIIEIGFTCDDLENVPVLRSFATTVRTDKETGRDMMYLSEDNKDKDLYLLFKHFAFTIAGQRLHKRDLWQWFAKNDYLQIRSNTIFCQAPVVHENGTWEPCGQCATCIGAIHEGLADAFTEAGLVRYHDYELNHEKEPERFRLKGFDRTPKPQETLRGGVTTKHKILFFARRPYAEGRAA